MRNQEDVHTCASAISFCTFILTNDLATWRPCEAQVDEEGHKRENCLRQLLAYYGCLWPEVPRNLSTELEIYLVGPG